MENHQKRLVLTILAYAAQRDVSVERLSRLSAIEVQELRENPQYRISHKQLDSLWRNAVHLSGDNLFGLHLGESMQLAALGIVGELIQNSRTIGEAITQAAAFTGLVTDIFDLSVTHSESTFSLNFVANPAIATEYPFVFRQMMDLFMVFAIYELDGLVLKKVKPQTVCLPINGTYSAEYRRVFRCENLIESEKYVLEFEDSYWHEPILTANYELQGLLLQTIQADSQTATQTETQTLKGKLHNYLSTNAYLGILSLEEIAANFNTSPRSLQRKLQAEGVTYHQLADTVRKSLALHYLASGKHPVKEISYMLGYNELSAFSRAFKRWTGTSPVHYQQNG